MKRVMKNYTWLRGYAFCYSWFSVFLTRTLAYQQAHTHKVNLESYGLLVFQIQIQKDVLYPHGAIEFF